MQRIYLDNAATSWPKPAEVYDAVDRWQRENGAPFGRGVYDSASATDRLVIDARRAVATLLGVDDPSRVVFALNGTDALHLAIARRVGCRHFFSLDKTLNRNAVQAGMRLVEV